MKDGSRIAIIGGGPAGSFFAHFIQKYAYQKGLNLSVTIFDGKDFLQPGPKGCNLCAGVLSASLHQRLNKEGIFLPETRIINLIDGYDLHVDDEHLLLTCAENKKDKIVTVFRGNGPRYSTFPDVVSFDDFLLTWAQDRETKVISLPVWDIELPKNKSDPACLLFGRKEKLQRFEADLVVGAFGVNSYLMKKIQSLGFGYKPPSTLKTYQAEFKMGREKVSENFGNTIHVYMPKSKNIRYATLIPKGDYVSVTLVGKKDVTKDIFSEFIGLEEIRNKIPPSKPPCFCYPKIVISPSKRPYSDRIVIIGDASFSRHYKNGIESAFMTAKLAAETAVKVGIDAASFSSHYYRKTKKLIIRDNTYGRFLFAVNDIISSIPLLTKSHLSLAGGKRDEKAAKKIRSILWNMFTGNIPYKKIFKISLDLQFQIPLLLNTLRLIFNSPRLLLNKPKKIHSRSTLPGALKNYNVAVIIGGGPAGTSCAIRLQNLITQKGIKARIILYEGKRFEKKSYYNQCLGVLSPPLENIMEGQLGIPFPWHIIQKKIEGYLVYSENNMIKLSGEHDPSYACRRVEFDNYLFQKAKDMGIEIIPARVTDLDFGPRGVMVYSESNNIKADVVVGAFGLDDGMAKTFERLTSYRQPKFLSSIVTKIHPGEESMKEFGTYLHAFLPSSLPHVEFGAITPKGNHLALNIAGKKVDARMMDQFLRLPSVKSALPDNVDDILPHLYYFKGKFPTLPAKGVFGDRYVIIGDAGGFNRPFKGKGINSAIITGIRAAESIVNHGISKGALQKYLEYCSDLTDDIPYGKTLRFLTILGSRYELLDSIFETAKNEPHMKKAFFNIVSGQKSYKKTWAETKSLSLLWRIMLKIIKSRYFKKRISVQNTTVS